MNEYTISDFNNRKENRLVRLFPFLCVNQKVELKTRPAFPVPDSVLRAGQKTESRYHLSWLDGVKA